MAIVFKCQCRQGVAAAASGPGRTSLLQEQEFVFLDDEGLPI
jgi:hypothetical protein